MVELGFKILRAELQIPKPRIPESTSKKFPRFRNLDYPTWGNADQLRFLGN